jgi:hypothetical protein
MVSFPVYNAFPDNGYHTYGFCYALDCVLCVGFLVRWHLIVVCFHYMACCKNSYGLCDLHSTYMDPLGYWYLYQM